MLETVGKPVGFGQAPTDGGWQGAPNTDGTNFVPYITVNPNASSAPRGVYEGPIGEWQADWQLSYSVSSFGVKPDQTEWMADAARMALNSLQGTSVDDDESASNSYLVQQVRVDTLGGLLRTDATEPPYWGQSDQVTIWLSKE